MTPILLATFFLAAAPDAGVAIPLQPTLALEWVTFDGRELHASAEVCAGAQPLVVEEEFRSLSFDRPRVCGTSRALPLVVKDYSYSQRPRKKTLAAGQCLWAKVSWRAYSLMFPAYDGCLEVDAQLAVNGGRVLKTTVRVDAEFHETSVWAVVDGGSREIDVAPCAPRWTPTFTGCQYMFARHAGGGRGGDLAVGAINEVRNARCGETVKVCQTMEWTCPCEKLR